MSKQNLQFSKYFPYVFYFSAFSAADTWWQPKHTSKEKEKNKGRKRRRYKQIPVKKTMIYQYLLDQGFEKKKFPKRTGPWLLSLLKNAIWSSKKGPPHKLPHLTIKAVIVLTNIWYSSIFYVSVSAANTWWHPNHTSKEELVLVNLMRSFPEAKICIGNGPLAGGICGGHLWGGAP